VRHRVELAPATQLTLIEQHERLQDAPVLNNCVIEADVAEDAHYRHLKLQRDTHQGFHMAHHLVCQQRNSTFSSFYAALGASVSRHFTHTYLLGEQAEMNVNSAGLATGDQVMDSRTFTDHATAHCTSRQVHKLVVDDRARGVFDGMIHVAPGAQKTDGLMDNKNLLLGPKAKVDAKPRLEIYADDVKCSHGSATGQLDPNQLFYARARGIDSQTAQLMITTAFLA
jgi:Fe-S cluster assembly protein SufD